MGTEGFVQQMKAFHLLLKEDAAMKIYTLRRKFSPIKAITDNN